MAGGRGAGARATRSCTFRPRVACSRGASTADDGAARSYRCPLGSPVCAPDRVRPEASGADPRSGRGRTYRPKRERTYRPHTSSRIAQRARTYRPIAGIATTANPETRVDLQTRRASTYRETRANLQTAAQPTDPKSGLSVRGATHDAGSCSPRTAHCCARSHWSRPCSEHDPVSDGPLNERRPSSHLGLRKRALRTQIAPLGRARQAQQERFGLYQPAGRKPDWLRLSDH